MAQSQTKQAGVPEVTRLPLMGAYSNRSDSGLKDQRFINMFPETRKVDQLDNTKIFLTKRPGLSLYKDFGSGEGRGIVRFNNKFYCVFGNTLWVDGTTPTALTTLTNSTGPVGMLVANSSTLGNYLFVCDGTNAWVIKEDNSVTQVTNSSVHSVTVTTAGAGYGSIPTVTFSAPVSGTTATGTAIVSAGVVTGVTIDNVGSGYTTAPTVTIAAPVTSFNAATAVNAANNTITLTGHSYATGAVVTYANGGGTSIGGLTTATTYYVVYDTANTIKLATSAANAAAGTVIDITSVGSGTQTLTGSVTAIASCTLNELPSPHTPTPVFIDGYVCLARANSVDVYTCDLDDPTKWASYSYLSAEMFPDNAVALSRQNNQIVVFGTNSIEFFYDAANVSGSPLSRNDSTTIQMGTCAPYCTIGNEKYVFYISQSESGGRSAWVIDGFQPKKISDEYIDRILNAEPDMSLTRGFAVRTKGHFLYIINLKSLNRTLVYDVDEKLWHEWSSNNSGNHSVFAYDFGSEMGTGAAYLQHTSDGTVSKLDPNIYQDVGTGILVDITTNRFDMDTIHRKFQSSVKIVGDRYETSNPVSLQWTNDDYQTWSNVKTIDLNDDYPAFHRLGAFRRRAFKLTHSNNAPLRLESLECEYTKGSS